MGTRQSYNVMSHSFYAHICICERFIYFQDWSAKSAPGKYVDRSWEYRSQTHECGIVTEAAQFPEKEYINGIFLAVYQCSDGKI
jgi:hypothetical protein